MTSTSNAASEGFTSSGKSRELLPKREQCTPDAVAKAMRFLTDEWLCDVLTDYSGKCVVIAAALTLIERSLLPDRPAFFVTAGRRGTGKTTLLIMLIVAVTGIWPAASAWSFNEEERLQGAALLFHVRPALYPLGQHSTRNPDQLPAHRKVLHCRLLRR